MTESKHPWPEPKGYHGTAIQSAVDCHGQRFAVGVSDDGKAWFWAEGWSGWQIVEGARDFLAELMLQRSSNTEQ